jgi:hypothetical protein
MHPEVNTHTLVPPPPAPGGLSHGVLAQGHALSFGHGLDRDQEEVLGHALGGEARREVDVGVGDGVLTHIVLVSLQAPRDVLAKALVQNRAEVQLLSRQHRRHGGYHKDVGQCQTPKIKGLHIMSWTRREEATRLDVPYLDIRNGRELHFHGLDPVLQGRFSCPLHLFQIQR